MLEYDDTGVGFRAFGVGVWAQAYGVSASES